MKMRFLSILSFILFFETGIAQITTDPVFPVASQKVVLTFDSSKESRLGLFSGELYAHTGVIIEGKTDWQHVIGNWNNNTVQPKLTNKGGGIYELDISPDINSFYNIAANEKITKLAFVFRSSDGSKQTHDLFVNVYQEGVVIKISAPGDHSILGKDETTTISATASSEGTISLLIGDNQIAQASGKEITASHTFTESGYQWIIAKIVSGAHIRYDSVSVYIRENTVSLAKPAGYKKGINYLSDNSVALVLWAPEKEFVYAIGSFNDWKLGEACQMKKDGNYFWLEINGLTKGQQYPFQYYIDGKIKIADPYCEQVSDPWNDSSISAITYPGLIPYPEGKTEGIASVLQTGQTPHSWEITNFQVPDKRKLVIYELLVRDFTSGHSYKAVREKLDYLEDLNINVLELMPVNEFENNSSWGYNPSFYFAPEKYYGPKNELKKLVDECHKRGIAVVIDMVLNHSYGQSPLVKMYWDETHNRPAANNPWYNPQSNFQNPDAQWGYDFNHESEYTRQLIDSINSFWISEYKVDGFRFDFTKGFSNTPYAPSSWGSNYDAPRIANLKRMAGEIWKRKADAIIIFEHLADNSEEKELANYGILLWGNMNGNYSEAAMGYHDNNKSELKDALYTVKGWNAPNLVAYMESHDEERLMYKNLQHGNTLGNYNIKQLPIALDRIGLNSVFFIPLPGPKMIWQFGELGYDYSINSNGGRLSEKPVRWDYAEERDRTDLFRVMSQLNYLKQTYDEFSAPVIQYNLTSEIKTWQMGANGNFVVAVGNFGLVPMNTSIAFPKTGLWYDYFGRNNFNVATSSFALSLQPGEYKLFSSRELDVPHVSTFVQKIPFPLTKIKLFPNPCDRELHVISEKIISHFQIVNMDGKVILTGSVNEKETKINTGSLSPGFYFLHISGKSNGTLIFIKK
ncbi:MAG: alpha-amylase family glycosyl hydrolase [Prolixibacteraceae bacterium]|jgi:hypothetical protein|nr:alpha-amylase family glycosyl hydrolase [Prolixibacteraceae bacterium]